MYHQWNLIFLNGIYASPKMGTLCKQEVYSQNYRYFTS